MRLEDRRDRGEFGLMIKKEAGRLMNEMERMNRYFGGIKEMKRLPGALFIVDPPMEHIAVPRRCACGIPIVAMCDTNCNPEVIDYPIPANDDAIRAIRLITARIADAALEGLSLQGYAAEAESTEGLDTDTFVASGTFSASPDDPSPATAVEPARRQTRDMRSMVARAREVLRRAWRSASAGEGPPERMRDRRAATRGTPQWPVPTTSRSSATHERRRHGLQARAR